MNPPAAVAPTTLMVCVTCRRRQDGATEGPYDEPGRGLVRTLADRLAGDADVTVTPVECLSVCRRPCTVAFAAPGKWTYVIGDLDADQHLDDLVLAARQYTVAADGIIPWRERPQPIRKGVVARVPPLACKIALACKMETTS
ncbi:MULTISPECIES: DUF1636 domain-containing protein [unclassified Chelatococcus]|uniref:DUF1636 family protein n=1 Tax=unclassified Chelatococcus TaxID=2638111 RepID=UPI001BCBAC9A|nr:MULTISPECIES: DUF1636 domain-containing protein [unclassified Chelatococcus]MBS7697715.1 DUF1636 domain-containing protein [Chelatococcus sp. YT9]MBX3558428.1 DUF1636 domain-containing protein [Chelatococcus sp.]